MRSAIENLWNNHRLATIAGAVGVIAVIIGGVAAYLILQRPEDKSCPDPCVIETTDRVAARRRDA